MVWIISWLEDFLVSNIDLLTLQLLVFSLKHIDELIKVINLFALLYILLFQRINLLIFLVLYDLIILQTASLFFVFLFLFLAYS